MNNNGENNNNSEQNNISINPTVLQDNNVDDSNPTSTPDLNNNVNSVPVNPLPEANNNVNDVNVNPTPIPNDNINNETINPAPNVNNNIPSNNPNINMQKYLKYGGIALGAIVVLVVAYFGFNKFAGTGGGHKNTTGLSSYSSSEVGLNCSETVNNSDNTTTIYMDFVFNKNNQTYIYMKTVKNYPNGLTDQKYASFVKAYDTYDDLKCGSYSSKCLEKHHEFSTGSGAFDIVIDRDDKNIEMTNYFVVSAGKTVTNKDIQDTKAEYEKDGYTCK